MRHRAKSIATRLSGVVLLALLAAGCGMAPGQSEPTPTIIPIPLETRAAIQTEQAARLLLDATGEVAGAGPSATPADGSTPATSGTALAAVTPVASEQTASATPSPAGVDTATPGADSAAPPTEHVVRRGENLTAIARLYGVTVTDLVQANDIENASTIYVGQVLLIPGPGAAVTPPPSPTPAAASTARAATSTPQPEPTATAGTSRIAFQVASGGEIWAVNEDGSGLVRLTQGLDPAWSPDGSRLAFVRWEEPRGLYVLDSAGGGERRVRGGNLMKSPTWSPGGDQIAFVWETSGAAPGRLCFPGFGCIDVPGRSAWSLTIVDLEGNTVADLPADERSFSPSWSPQGNLIAYQGERALKGTDIGAQPWVIVDDLAASFPAVSPDGNRILFMYRQHDHWEVYVVGSDGAGVMRLTETSPLAERAPNNVAPTWSPDGERVLFLSDRDGGWRPYVMAADGSNQEPFLPEVLGQFTFRYDFAAERVFSWR